VHALRGEIRKKRIREGVGGVGEDHVGVHTCDSEAVCEPRIGRSSSPKRGDGVEPACGGMLEPLRGVAGMPRGDNVLTRPAKAVARKEGCDSAAEARACRACASP
jgi:hypothetical protein